LLVFFDEAKDEFQRASLPLLIIMSAGNARIRISSPIAIPIAEFGVEVHGIFSTTIVSGVH
jgi:hypothetical protein